MPQDNGFVLRVKAKAESRCCWKANTETKLRRLFSCQGAVMLSACPSMLHLNSPTPVPHLDPINLWKSSSPGLKELDLGISYKM